MCLAHGGHLTHGSPVNISRQVFQRRCLRLYAPKTERIDYDEVERSSRSEHKPKMIVAGARPIRCVIDWKRFREIADEVGAYLFVDMAHYRGSGRGRHAIRTPSASPISSPAPRTRRCAVRAAGIILAKPEHEKALNSAIFPGLQGGPLMHVIAAKAVAFKEALPAASSRTTRSR